MKNLIIKLSTSFLLGLVILISFSSCSKLDQTCDLQITTSANITSYLEEYPETFSLFLTMLDRDLTLSNGNTIKYGSFLNAYGEYTLFAPTNDAVNTYLTSHGYSDVSAIPDDTLKDLLDFTILQDTVSTAEFTDSKISTATMYGQYLIVGSVNVNGTTKIRVNKQAYITTKNIDCGNGLIHVIDGVLEPSTVTTAQMLESDGRFTIFVEALKATGYYDTLNVYSDVVANTNWRTVMATPDSVYEAAGINSYEDLYNKYCNSGTPTSTTDSLNLYVAYHILSGLKFIADFTSGATYSTMVSDQVLNITLSGDSVLVNQVEVSGETIKGKLVYRSESDNPSRNGVWHVMKENYGIITYDVSRIFMDLSDYDVIRSATAAKGGTWGVSGTTTSIQFLTNIDGISMYGKYSAYTYFYYIPNTSVSASTASVNNGSTYINYNNIGVIMRYNSGLRWIKFQTPFIPISDTKKTFKVWIAWRKNGGKLGTFQCTASVGQNVLDDNGDAADSVDLANTLDLYSGLPSRGSRLLYEYDNYLYGLGYKRPMQIKGQTSYKNTVNCCYYLGKVTFTSSSKHWFKLTTLTTGDKTYTHWLDYIEFIPDDESQIWPKYDQDGTVVSAPASDTYDDGTTAIY